MSLSLEFKDVSKRYPSAKRAAVEKLNLRLEEGEICALVGESGSGKSTLLRLAAGLEVPDEGEIRLGGDTVAGEKVWIAPEKREVGLVFQDGALFPHLTVEKNLVYGLQRKSVDEKRSISDSMLKIIGLTGKQKRYPHELSGGERQRLAIARSLAPKPRVILLDEPFGNLDPALQLKMREEIRMLLSEMNATAILVTHDPSDSLALTQKIVILRDGRVEQVGSPNEVYRNPKDLYCATLFGPANSVRPTSGAALYVRPENMSFCDAGSSGSVAVKVTRIHETGKCREVFVYPTDSSRAPDGVEWMVLDRSGADIREGAELWVEF